MGQFTRNEMKRRILQNLSANRKGLSPDKLASSLHIRRSEHARFLLTLSQMEKEGDIIRGAKGRYAPTSSDCVKARMVSLSRGFGFARPEGGGADCFIPGRDLQNALPGDTVLLHLEPDDPRGPAGKVVQILEKSGHLYTGRLHSIDGRRWEVLPDAFIRYPLPAKKSKSMDAADGSKVRFSAEFSTADNQLTAVVLTSYGSADSAKVCADSIVDAAGIPSVFPPDVLDEARRLREAGVTEADLEGRTDLRDWTIFTIDGYDAKDLDDAVSLDLIDGGWRLGVHIADVSHYVRVNTLLDKEAQRRATSVYFADRVIPMLPVDLSNGICSLNAGTDKLTLSVIMTLDKNGVCKDAVLRKTVINSRVRGVYREINSLFDGTADDTVVKKYEPVRESLNAMRALAAKLKEAAAKRGIMDLISTESSFVLDQEGHPVEIYSRVTGESEEMIEQFMIAANQQVAAFAGKRGIPFVYRIHEQPDPEKLRTLSEIAQRLELKNFHLETPFELRALMDEAKSTPYARLISDRMLRSMAKARYSEIGIGHYGLALKDYCHFTSPIRRYPDLSIHRILTDALAGVAQEEIIRRYAAFAQEAASFSSEYEIRAMTAERECEDCYKAEYMSRFIGRAFEGVISSVSSFGVFVELPNSIEGLVKLETLEEELRYDDVASLVDRRGRPRYTVGDTMKVLVVGTDVSAGRIDFEPEKETQSDHLPD